MTRNSAYLEGREARINGRTLADNPFIYGTAISELDYAMGCDWARGWGDVDGEILGKTTADDIRDKWRANLSEGW